MDKDKDLFSEVKRLQNGDHQALESLYIRFHKDIYVYAVSLCKSQSLAEDIVQDVFIKVWNYRKNIDTSKSFKAFLFTITRNLTFDTLKKIVNNHNLCQEIYFQNNRFFSDPDEELITSDYLTIYKEALQKLTPKRREIFEMSRVEKKSYQEISDILGISIQTVKNQMSRSLKIISSFLKKRGLPLIIFIFII